jgi:hypothetical protein
MKVTMRIKVYTLLMMSAVMVGNTVVNDLDAFGYTFDNDQIIIFDQADDEDEGWHAEEFDLKLQKF